eukprot:IDg20358t1
MGNSLSEHISHPNDFEQSPDFAQSPSTPQKPATSPSRLPLNELSPNHSSSERRYRDNMAPADRHRTQNVSRPTDVKRRIHVEFDPSTGTYKGLDEAIREVYSSPSRSTFKDVRESRLSPMKPILKNRQAGGLLHDRIRRHLLPSSSSSVDPDLAVSMHPDREEASISAA